MSARNKRTAKDARSFAQKADLARREALRHDATDKLVEKLRNDVRKLVNEHNERLESASLEQLREAFLTRRSEGQDLPTLRRRATRQEFIDVLKLTVDDEDKWIAGELGG